jgi:hypothetical protein
VVDLAGGKRQSNRHGRGWNRTTEFYNHFLDLGAALNTFGGRGFNILMIDMRAHG